METHSVTYRCVCSDSEISRYRHATEPDLDEARVCCQAAGHTIILRPVRSSFHSVETLTLRTASPEDSFPVR